jgi:hypothetical protein
VFRQGSARIIYNEVRKMRAFDGEDDFDDDVDDTPDDEDDEQEELLGLYYVEGK